MKATIRAIGLTVAVLMSGCASQYRYSGDANSAKLTIAGNSKQFYVESYKDASCTASEYGVRLATFYGPTANVQDNENGITLPIPAGKEFVYTFRYIDAKFALNRMCSVTVGFVPRAGATYKTYFSVDSAVTGCDVALKEIAADKQLEVSSFYVNENLCLGGGNKGSISGKPERLRWRATVITR
jgi:hypothetical protein